MLPSAGSVTAMAPEPDDLALVIERLHRLVSVNPKGEAAPTYAQLLCLAGRALLCEIGGVYFSLASSSSL